MKVPSQNHQPPSPVELIQSSTCFFFLKEGKKQKRQMTKAQDRILKIKTRLARSIRGIKLINADYSRLTFNSSKT